MYPPATTHLFQLLVRIIALPSFCSHPRSMSGVSSAGSRRVGAGKDGFEGRGSSVGFTQGERVAGSSGDTGQGEGGAVQLGSLHTDPPPLKGARMSWSWNLEPQGRRLKAAKEGTAQPSAPKRRLGPHTGKSAPDVVGGVGVEVGCWGSWPSKKSRGPSHGQTEGARGHGKGSRGQPHDMRRTLQSRRQS